MEWLLRHVTAGKTAAFLALMAAINVGFRYRTELESRVMRRLYPPLAGSNADGADIARETETREAGRVEARYRRLLAQLDQAQADGFKVDALRQRAETALKLNAPSYRRHAVQLLTEVEMAVPRKRKRYIPLNVPGAPGEDVAVATPKGEPVGRAKLKAGKRR
jgi:hypothetical protein